MSRRRVAIVFDLTPDMLFRLTDGTTVTLAELERMVRLAPATGYAPWDPESRTAKRVLANISSHGLALYDVKTRESHRWAHEAPPDDDGELREALKALFADTEISTTPKPIWMRTPRAFFFEFAWTRRCFATPRHGCARSWRGDHDKPSPVANELANPARAARPAPCGHRRARHRDQGRGIARRSRLVLAMARRSCCGISVAWRADGEMHAIYIPLRHPDTDNFDPDRVYRWLKDLVASDVRIVTHNGVYDFGWLRAEGGVVMPPSDRLEETGALATMIDENQFSYSLDSLCGRYGLPGKDEALLRQAVEAAGFAKGRKKVNPQEHIWRLPARYVGPYAEADAVNTLLLFEKLDPILDQENIRSAYRLEIDLLPMVLEMRRRGIRIDQDAAEQARDLLLGKRDAALAKISEQHGAPVGMDEINGRKWKEKTFEQYGIPFPRTEKGNPSFSAGKSGWMATHPHWLPQGIAIANKYEAARDQVSRRTYSRTHRWWTDSRRDPPVSRGRGRHALVALQLLRSAAAADAGSRQGIGAADPQRVPAGRG